MGMLDAPLVPRPQSAFTLTGLTDIELVTVDASTPVFLDVVDGVAYGLRTTPFRLYKSLDSGTTWTLVGSMPASIGGFRKCMDGEVLGTSNSGLYRSTGWAAGNPTWTLVQAPTSAAGNTAQFQPWGLDTFDGWAVAAEYISGVADFSASRYAYVSDDDGFTWAPMFDLQTYAAEPNTSHLHAVAIDRQTMRFWLSWHGGAEQDETWYSNDFGATWTHYDTAGNLHPTVIYDHAAGMIMGTDSVPDSMLLVEPTFQPQFIYQARLGDPSLFGFAKTARTDGRGWTYMGWQSQQNGTPAIILCSPDGYRADEIYRFTNAGTAPEIPAIGVTAQDKFIARVRPGDGTERFLRATPPKRTTLAENELNRGGILRGLATQRSVAVGEGAIAGQATQSDRAVAVGQYANALADNTVCVGQKATSAFVGGTAVGSLASITASYGTATGMESQAGDQGSAYGRGSISTGTRSVAVGLNASATGTDVTVLGRGGAGTHARSVTLGSTTVSERIDCVHVGDRDIELQGSGRGIRLRSATGVKWRLVVDDAGVLETVAV